MALKPTTNLFSNANIFGRVRQALAKQSFEIQFKAIERTVIKKINKEIDAATNDGTVERLNELQDKQRDLAKRADSAREYRFGLETNSARFLEISSAAGGLVNTHTSSTTLSADEADTLNARKAEIVDNIRRLKLLRFPDFSDGNITNRLRQDAETLESLTAVAGTVDSATADPQTNDNRRLLDVLDDISDRALIYKESTELVIDSVNDFLIDAQTELLDIETDLTLITAVQLERNTQKVDDIKLKYATLLKAISLSFEVNSGLADILNKGSNPPPEKGSILNLFT